MDDDMHLVAEVAREGRTIKLLTDDGRGVALLDLVWCKLSWPDHCPDQDLVDYDRKQTIQFVVDRLNGVCEAVSEGGIAMDGESHEVVKSAPVLKPIELEALRDCASYAPHYRYIWKPRTMERLAAKGLVEAYPHREVGYKGRVAYRLTDAGRRVASQSVRASRRRHERSS
jgi:hypothetical protein